MYLRRHFGCQSDYNARVVSFLFGCYLGLGGPAWLIQLEALVSFNGKRLYHNRKKMIWSARIEIVSKLFASRAKPDPVHHRCTKDLTGFPTISVKSRIAVGKPVRSLSNF